MASDPSIDEIDKWTLNDESEIDLGEVDPELVQLREDLGVDDASSDIEADDIQAAYIELHREITENIGHLEERQIDEFYQELVSFVRSPVTRIRVNKYHFEGEFYAVRKRY